MNNIKKIYKGKLPTFFLILFVFNMLPLFLFAQNSINVIIPKPQKIFPGKGKFILTEQTRYFSNTSLSQNAIAYLQKHLKQNAGYLLKTGKVSKNKSIHFHYNPEKIKKSEGYRLHIEKEKIMIEARDKAGFFYAVVSLMQLMDSSIWGQSVSYRVKKTWSIPSCTIEDHPRFKWRGMMLDTSRNFFSTDYVKKFIDRMAQHKLNRRYQKNLSKTSFFRLKICTY